MPYIFITALSDQHTLRRAEEVHPVGYIVKPFREDDLRASITIGMSNHQRRNSITEVTLEYVNSHAFDPLSGKEYEILNHIAKGYTNTQIAEKLELSTNTVKWHTQNIYSKLGVKNRTAAAQFLNGL
jgi:DNA-binding NarL/FixJ family response regulator